MTLPLVNDKTLAPDITKYRGEILAWYDRHRRDIPWRAKPGIVPDPYHVWLSEIMCQQTTVQAVRPYFLKFIERWPNIADLAHAKEQDIMAAWAGLGYYARARNLHKCAKIVAQDLGGVFPRDQAALKKLPGIGDYTSAAIAAIAFNQPSVVVDGNVERVIARFFAVTEPLPAVKPRLKELAGYFFTDDCTRPGDLAQAFMDLGAGICIPKTPRCSLCPLNAGCMAYQQGIAADLPMRKKAALRPQRYGKVYWIEDAKGRIIFERRQPRGLLGGMVGLPTSAWSEETEQSNIPPLKNLEAFPLNGQFINHTFTHFDLKLDLQRGQGSSIKLPAGFYWAKPEQEIDHLPSVFKKALRLFLSQIGANTGS